MLALRAQHAHAAAVGPAVQLQEPLVLFADPLLQHGHRWDQLVDPQGGHPQVWLQVTLAIGGQARQAGFHSLGPLSRAHVAIYEAFGRWGGAPGPPQADLLTHFLSEGVLAKLRASVKDGPTLGAAEAGALPVPRDAGEAEAVAAGDGDGLAEDILTDQTAELLLAQRNGGGHDLDKEEKRA